MRQSFKSKSRTCQKLNNFFIKICLYLKSNCSQKPTFWIMLLHESDIFCIFPAFRNASFGIRNITTRHIRNKKITKSQFFCSNLLQFVRIWTKTYTTFQKMKWKISKRFRIWKNLIQKSPFDFFYNVKTT